MRIKGIVFLLMASISPLFAQNQSQQLWFDFQFDYPFANRYLFETEASYQTIISSQNKWRSISLTPTFEFSLLPKIDLIGNLPIQYVFQKQDDNTFEVRPTIGGRYYFSQGKRVDARLVLKMEERYFHEIEASDWEIVNRVRAKLEAFISINGPNMFTDKLWYAIVDYEEFFVLDKQVNERFANRRRARLGLGYRLNYRNRFELIYTKQSTRNEVDQDFISDDNVLQFRFKFFFNAAKVPVKKDTP